MSELGHSRRYERAPFTSGLPRLADILRVGRHVSKGQERKCPGSRGTSVLPSGADIVSLPQHVRLAPKADKNIE